MPPGEVVALKLAHDSEKASAYVAQAARPWEVVVAIINSLREAFGVESYHRHGTPSLIHKVNPGDAR
jgi:hypothetical protein